MGVFTSENVNDLPCLMICPVPDSLSGGSNHCSFLHKETWSIFLHWVPTFVWYIPAAIGTVDWVNLPENCLSTVWVLARDRCPLFDKGYQTVISSQGVWAQDRDRDVQKHNGKEGKMHREMLTEAWVRRNQGVLRRPERPVKSSKKESQGESESCGWVASIPSERCSGTIVIICAMF